MCTVTYIPANNGYILTSSRDEHIARGNTLSPQDYWHGTKRITYPKDEKGNGTWIAHNEHGAVAVLLNGAFKKHISNPPYKHSRGLLIPAILQTDDPVQAITTMDVNGIEPFTIILYANGLLFEFRWDEVTLSQQQLDINKAYCWNSATLYAEKEVAANRQALAELFTQNITAEEVISFHQQRKYELQLPSHSIMNHIKTISISQVAVTNSRLQFLYYDLLTTSMQNT